MAETTFNVSAAYDKPAYNAGETMKIVLSGNATFVGDPTTSTAVSGALDIVGTADNGITTNIALPPLTITTTIPPVPQSLNVVISSVADTSSRIWTIAADGKSATATA